MYEILSKSKPRNNSDNIVIMCHDIIQTDEVKNIAREMHFVRYTLYTLCTIWVIKGYDYSMLSKLHLLK